MVNEIYMDGGRKKARPVTNRADYVAQRNHPDNVKNFYDARGGDQKAKARQRQYNYGDDVRFIDWNVTTCCPTGC